MLIKSNISEVGKLKTEKRKSDAGQSLFEVIFAIGMSALILTGVVSLSSASVANVERTEARSFSSRFLQEAMDFLRDQRDRDWDNLKLRASTSGTTWCLPTLDWPTLPVAYEDDCVGLSAYPAISRKVTLTLDDEFDPTEINAEIWIYWTDSMGFHKSSISTVYVNWREINFYSY
jgi:type II secretory pathway pseudopilin PulG